MNHEAFFAQRHRLLVEERQTLRQFFQAEQGSDEAKRLFEQLRRTERRIQAQAQSAGFPAQDMPLPHRATLRDRLPLKPAKKSA